MKHHFVSTANGYWGRGETLKEACKNAKVTVTKTEAYIIVYDPEVVEIAPNGIGGYTWLSKCDIPTRDIDSHFIELRGSLKMVKGQPQLTVSETH